MGQPSPLMETFVWFQMAFPCAFGRLCEPSNARGERQPPGTGPGAAKKPALWAVRSSALFGAVLSSGKVHAHWSPLFPDARVADPVDFQSATLR